MEGPKAPGQSPAAPLDPAAHLTVDLAALARNWRHLAGKVGSARCAAVVKANGYGLGAVPVAQALAEAGCTTFFVAQTGEAVQLRAALPDPEIYVLHGPGPNEAPTYRQHRLRAVLSSDMQIDLWRSDGRTFGPQPAVLHVDTGMNRLGISAVAAQGLDRDRDLALVQVMSHLACADRPEHPLNQQQLDRFRAVRALFPGMPASLANSAGIFLGPDYHFDLVRPGIALYGGNPVPGQPQQMAEVVHLQGRILQVRDVDSSMTVGYGATHQVTAPARIATVAVGYADGYLRALSNRGYGVIGGVRVPVIGRVSMDLLTLDVSAVPPGIALPNALVSLLGGGADLGELGSLAASFDYELLTRLGGRFARHYRHGNG